MKNNVGLVIGAALGILLAYLTIFNTEVKEGFSLIIMGFFIFGGGVIGYIMGDFLLSPNKVAAAATNAFRWSDLSKVSLCSLIAVGIIIAIFYFVLGIEINAGALIALGGLTILFFAGIIKV